MRRFRAIVLNPAWWRVVDSVSLVRVAPLRLPAAWPLAITLNVPVLLASGAANIRGVEFDLASESFVAIDQPRFLPDLPDSRAEDDSTAGAFNLANHLNPSTPNTNPLSNPTGISTMNVKTSARSPTTSAETMG